MGIKTRGSKKKTASKIPDLNPDMSIITCKWSKQRLGKDDQNGLFKNDPDITRMKFTRKSLWI